jgi:hypothetical protein
MIEGEGPSEGKRAAPHPCPGVAHALVLCQTYGMDEMFNFVIHIYHQLVAFVADNTAFAIVMGAIFAAVISVDEVRLHRRNRAER